MAFLLVLSPPVPDRTIPVLTPPCKLDISYTNQKVERWTAPLFTLVKQIFTPVGEEWELQEPCSGRGCRAPYPGPRVAAAGLRW